MSKKTFLTLCAPVFVCLVLGLPSQASAEAASPVQAAGKESPAAVADKEKPVQQGHLKATEEEMKKIIACAKKKGVEDIASDKLDKEKQKIVDQCYRDNGVVPPRDMKSYGTMKGQYY